MRRTIAHWHLLGATVWAYSAGAASVKPWTDGRDHAAKLRRRA